MRCCREKVSHPHSLAGDVRQGPRSGPFRRLVLRSDRQRKTLGPFFSRMIYQILFGIIFRYAEERAPICLEHFQVSKVKTASSDAG